MIHVTVRRVAEKRGIKTPYQLAVTAGIPQSLASRLWKGNPLPKLESLDRLCETWGVPLSDLVTWQPTRKQRTPSSPQKATRKRSS